MMTSVTQRVISALNNLVEVCKDGEQGFRTAANALSNAEPPRLDEHPRWPAATTVP